MKKHVLSLLLAAVTFFFAGCIDTTEELTINADGTGAYRIGMDMSGLFDMIEMMKGMDATADANGSKKKERMDTTMSMRDFTDTARHLTAKQKALLQPARMHMLMDEAARQFQINMNFPFSKITDVEPLMQISQADDGGNVMSKLFKGSGAAGAAGAGDGQMPDINSYYDTKVTTNLIERTLNKEKYLTLQQNDQAASLQQAGDMLESFKMNTVIKLPRAAKSVTGKNATLSADKKTLTVKATMKDLFESPDAFVFRIDY